MRAIAEGVRCIWPPSVTRKDRIETGYDDDEHECTIPVWNMNTLYQCGT